MQKHNAYSKWHKVKADLKAGLLPMQSHKAVPSQNPDIMDW